METDKLNHLERLKKIEKIELEIKQIREQLKIDSPAWNATNAVVFELNNLIQALYKECDTQEKESRK
jgi:hypothetical protein